MKYLNFKLLILFAALALAIPPAWAETVTLSNANIVSAGSAKTGYQLWTITDGGGNTWNAYAIKNQHSNATSNYHYLQIRKYTSGTAYYIQVPELGTKITRIVMTVSSSNKPMGDGGNTATLYFSSSNSTSTTGNGVASGTGDKSVSIDCSSLDLNQGYITASAGVRIWDITVTYDTGGSSTPIPSIEVDPEDLDINDDGGVFTVSAANMPNNGLGAKVDSSSPSKRFSFTNVQGDNSFNDLYDYFPLTVNNNNLYDLSNGKVQVNYTGHALSAAGVIAFESGSERTTADVNYLYDGDIYIVGDVEGSGWSTEGGTVHGVQLAKNADGTYSAAVTATAGGEGFSWLYFTRSLNASNYDNLGYDRFGPAGDYGSWSYTSNLNDVYCDLDTAGNLHTIKMSPGQYVITIDPENNKFKIFEVAGPKIYNKVTDASQLIAGKTYILVYEDTPAFMGAISTTSTKYGLSITGPSITGNSVDIGQYSDIRVLTLSGDENGWSFHNGDGYLSWTSGNSLNTASEVNNNSKWTVTEDFSLLNVANSNRKLLYNTNPVRFACYDITSSTVSGLAVLYVEDGVEPVLPAVVAPTILPAEREFDSSVEVSMTCATTGATIYYTLDGTEPTTSSTVYSAPFTLNATTTVKAIAVLGNESSQVVTATFTKTGIETIAAAQALPTSGTQANFTFVGNAVVTFHNSNHLYIRDESGSGLIYGVNAETKQYQNGDLLTPGWKAKNYVYQDHTPEFTNPSDVGSTVNNGPVAPEILTTLALADVNKYAGFNNVTITRVDDVNYYFTVDRQEICLRRAYTNLVEALEVGKVYNVEGVVAVFDAAPQLNLTKVTIVQQDPNMSFAEQTVNATFGADFNEPALTKPEGVTVTYSSSDPAVAEVNETTGEVTIKKVGNATITATSVANQYYTSGTASYNIVVTAGTPTFAYSDATATAVFGQTATLPTLDNPNSLTVTYTSSNQAVATVNENGEVTIVGAGTTVITATGAATGNYNGATATYTLTVSKAQATLAFEQQAINAIYGGEAPANALTNEAGLTVTYSIDPEGVATIDPATGKLRIVGVGTATVTATGEANANYEGATASYTLTVSKAQATLAFEQQAINAIYGGEAPANALTNEAGLTVTYSIDPEGVATIDPATGKLRIVGVGTATVTATGEANANYEGATATYTLTVSKAQATLTFAKGTINATIGGEVEANPLTNEANLTVTYSSSGTNVATVDATTGEVNIVGTGSAIITATGAENDNYLGTTATYTINVAAADAITFTLNTDVMNYTVGDEVKVKVDNVQNAIGDYTITYKIGDTELVPDENGYVTIPTAEVGEVTLTVTVADAYEHSTEATETFVFNIAAADAITFTLTPDGGEYTVGDKVNVKVGNIQNTIGDYTITYTTNFTREPQTYDPEQGIDITSDEAGQVNLTVTVTDAYEHAAEGTKSAVYKFAAAPAIEITLNPDGGEYIVGDVVNVTVAVDKTLGDYTVVYQIDGGEAQNYDTATGIVITRSTVGNVDLTVTVTDGYEHEGDGTASATYVFKPVPVVAAPTFSLASGTYDTPQDVTITGPEGATIYYSVDGGLTWTEGNSLNMTETTILMAKAVKDGIESPVVTNAYVIKQTVERIPVEPIDGYFSIKNNGNNMFANVQGRKTLTFCDDADKEAQAGTVIYVKTDEYGQVQSLRSQAADLQGYADRAMRYVPDIVEMIVNKLHATGAGEVLGETGYEAIMEKFNESFDHHLYVEKNDELGYRIYGKTPSMQPVVDFYAENKSKVDAKLPMLEGFINDAIDKVLNKTGGHGASILQHFSVHETWHRMGETLTEPVDSASTMAFYQQVLCNKDNVWSFAYETAMTYWERVKAHEDQYESLKEKLGEFAQYIDEIEQINPDFKYYIVQNNNKPDFISEGNGDIINNAARTYWTLVPRTTFKVNFPEANAFGGDDDTKYAVTLYTDFAYTVPEGVTANKVTEVAEDGLATYEAISGVIPAQTPVMLISQSAGEKELTLSTASAAAVTENLLKGPDYLVDNYDLVTPQVQALFEFAKSVLGDDLYNNYLKEYEHLMMLNSGTVNNKYFWGLNEDDTWTCLEENADGVLDCVVRSLGVDQNGNFAFNTKEVRTNEAFLVDAVLGAITLYQEQVATPEFSLVPGSYTGNQTLEITCDTEGAEISYSLDGGYTWNIGTTVTLTEDCTVMAKATKDGMEESAVATAQYIIDQPTVITPIEPIDGYFKIMNNGNNKYANVQGRKTLTFTDAPDDQAGTVIYVKTNDKGQVQSLRSQAADLQGYADRAMNYVPQFVNLVVDKLNADGEGNLLGENGLGEIMEKFDSCFDHHLYVEEAEGGYRIYGKTPNMQDVVDFYRAHTEQVETKLPMLEDFINTALTKLRDKIGGSSIFTPFSLHQIWQNMGGTLTEPTNEASTMAFYREVLNNKNYVWDFAYQTAMIYWTNVKSHPRYEELRDMMGEYADYIERIEDIHPDFKYYIVQNNDKPDFISEGNGDIINNAARTIWTLTPRDEFTVNIPEENMFGCPLHPMYGKTLYTDFAYTLPEGVKAYAVDSISPRGTIQTVEITGIIPAQTPVLLKAETFGDKVITISTTDGAAVAENLLKGPDYLIDEYKIVTPMVADMFNMAKDILGEDFYNSYLKEYEHLMMLNSGTVNNKYFWGLNEDDTWTCLEENADGVLDCVVRSLGIDDNGIFAFNKKEVRVNEAFMATTAFDALNLYQKGDVNHDGTIDIDDITATIDRVLGKTPQGYFCTVCADVFEDNIIDIDDVTALIDIVLGK